MKKELEDRDKRSESPKRAEKIKRRNRLKEGVRLLKADLARAQHLVMEANSLCDRLNREVHFSVTLRIPPERLGPTGKFLESLRPTGLEGMSFEDFSIHLRMPNHITFMM